MYGQKCTSYHSCYLVLGYKLACILFKSKNKRADSELPSYSFHSQSSEAYDLPSTMQSLSSFLELPQYLQSPNNKQIKQMIIGKLGFCEDFQFEILFHTFSEVEHESNSNMAKVPHSSSPCSLSPNRLLAPII